MKDRILKSAERAIDLFFGITLSAASVGCYVLGALAEKTAHSVFDFLFSIGLGMIAYLQIKEFNVEKIVKQ
jgi:hypothetical protein